MALVPLPLSGQQPHSLPRVLPSFVEDNTLGRHVTEDNTTKKYRAVVMLTDVARKNFRIFYAE
jgi:hypothetical protein